MTMNIDFIKQLILKLINEQLDLLYKNKGEAITSRDELDKYILSLDDLILNLEEKKKSYNGTTPTAVKILFYVLGDNNQKEIIQMGMQKVTETKKYGFKAVDSFGNEAVVEGAMWALSNPALGTLAPSEDGKEVTFIPAGQVEALELQLKVDSKIGEGEVILNGAMPITLLPGDAVTVEIKEIV
jgi:hypothetical protein